MNDKHLLASDFKLTILGSSSALPTSERNPTAQVLNIRERFFLIDCGEGTQIQLRKYRARLGKINQIFISHLHGDHFYGLFGLLSTFSLLGRKHPLQIFSPPGLKKILLQVFTSTQDGLSYPIVFNELKNAAPEWIFENDFLKVMAIPMKHRIACYGFKFTEKEHLYNLNKSAIQQAKLTIPEIHAARSGEDIVRENGRIIPNKQLILGRRKARTYVYYADTAYHDEWISEVAGADLLYHEATFLEEKKDFAHQTGHSTTLQAAEFAQKAGVAKLIIGHFSSRYKNLTPFLEETQSIFPHVELAEDGKSFEIPCKWEE